MSRRIVSAGLLCAMAASLVPEHASACAVPRPHYDPASADAIMTATITRVRGRGYAEAYEVRRDSIVLTPPDSEPPPRRLTIKLSDHLRGTCGPDGPQLVANDKIVIYFGFSREGLLVDRWILVHRA
jgi:hypothetical protein